MDSAHRGSDTGKSSITSSLSANTILSSSALPDISQTLWDSSCFNKNEDEIMDMYQSRDVYVFKNDMIESGNFLWETFNLNKLQHGYIIKYMYIYIF